MFSVPIDDFRLHFFRRLLGGSGNELSEDYGNSQESTWQPDPGSLANLVGQLFLGRFPKEVEVSQVVGVPLVIIHFNWIFQ